MTLAISPSGAARGKRRGVGVLVLVMDGVRAHIGAIVLAARAARAQAIVAAVADVIIDDAVRHQHHDEAAEAGEERDPSWARRN